MLAGIGSVALAYSAGTLATLSPCVLPLLPIILLSALQQHAWGPIAVVAGLSASFTGLGLLVAAFGLSLEIDPTLLRSVVAVLVVVAGLALLFPSLQSGFAIAAAPVANGGQALIDRINPKGLGGQALLGALLGAIWSPCAGPTLGAALGLAAQSETAGRAALIMLSFSLGAATPLVALAYGSKHAIGHRREWLARLSRVGKPLMGMTLVGVGSLVLTGLDKIVEAGLTRAMPDWLVTVTTGL